MRRLIVFNHVTLDGYFTDARGDMSWAHRQDPEWSGFVAENARRESQMLFGRVTYEMMAGFWPTPAAMASLPAVAERMNSAPKVVFSRTLRKADWHNTELVSGDMVSATRRLKRAAGPDMVIFGSGTIIAQLTSERLIDEYLLVVNPLVLGGGRSMFDGVRERLPLRRTSTRSFANGNVLLAYEPAR